MCGTAMPTVNSDAKTPAGAPGLVQFLADDHGVGRVAAVAADLLGEADAEQAGLGGCAVQVARQFAGPLPLVDVRQDLAFGEGAHRLSQLLAFGCGPDAHQRVHSFRDVDVSAAQPFAEALGLRVEAGLVGDALAEDAVDDEVHRAQIAAAGGG